MKKYGFYKCAVCREWFEASLVSERAVGPVCYRCLNANVDWAASEPPSVAPAEVPLDQQLRAAGAQPLPGMPT